MSVTIFEERKQYWCLTGTIYVVHTRTYSPSALGHSFPLPKNILHESYHSFNINQITTHFFHCITSQRHCGLDGGSAEGIIGLDRTYTFSHPYYEHKNEPSTLGKLWGRRKRSSSFSWIRPDLPSKSEGRRGVCSSSWKCGCIYYHAASSITISTQVFESKVSGPEFRSWPFVVRH